MVNLAELKAFYEGRKVLITGHTGFKGAWSCVFFRELGADLFGYALAPPADTHIFNLLQIENTITSVIGDIRDYEKLSQFVQEVKPEIVIHMAAQPLVIDSYNDPLNTYTTNVTGTANILNAIREIGEVKVFLNITTDKVYKNNRGQKAFHEEDELGGDDPYSSSKACSELLTESFKKSFFLDDVGHMVKGIATARAGNVIGGGDFSPNRIIPDIFRSLQANKELLLRYPLATRPWQHVLEPIYVYAVLCHKLYESPDHYSGAWNVGPDLQDVITVENLVRLVSQTLDTPIPYKSHSNLRKKEASTLALDCSKLKKELGWKPGQSLQTTIKMLCEWYDSFARGENLSDLTIKQVSDFLDR